LPNKEYGEKDEKCESIQDGFHGVGPGNGLTGRG